MLSLVAYVHGVWVIQAKTKDGNILIAGRKMTGVTDKQVDELGISTPMHQKPNSKKLEPCLKVEKI